MLESRKRPLSEDRDDLVVKKRALDSMNDSPIPVNGHSDITLSEPKDEDNLDNFRKGALFRRMRHYSRAFERSQRRVTQLEQERFTRDADFASVENSLALLYGTIDMLVKPEDLINAEDCIEDITEFNTSTALNSPELVESLRKRMEITQKFVAAFVRLAGQSKLRSSNEILEKCHNSQRETTSLRSELQLKHKRLTDVEKEKSQYYDDLVAAESRLDRLRSTNLHVIGEYKQSGMPMKLDEVKEEVADEKKPIERFSPAPAQLPTSELHEGESKEDLQRIKLLYEDRIAQLEKEIITLRDQLTKLEVDIKALPEYIIEQTAFYSCLKNQKGGLENSLHEAMQEKTRIWDELEQFKENRKSWESDVVVATSREVDELSVALKKRDEENVRLRQKRDQQLAEIAEWSSNSSMKSAQLKEFRFLSEAQSERISILQAEIRRLKSHIAAVHGDEDLLSFLSNGEESSSHVDDLKRRLGDVEAKYEALKLSINDRDSETVSKIFQEADLRRQLSEAQMRLQKFGVLLGPDSPLSYESQTILQQLQNKQNELDAFKLKESYWEQSQSSLYAELEKLSSAWERVESQLKSKVFELAAMEDKLGRYGLEKAKADNKFYAVMREKEVSAAERKSLQRDLEKAMKHREALENSEKSLQNAIGNYERTQKSQDELLFEMKTEIEKLKIRALNTDAHLTSEQNRNTEYKRQLLHKDGSLVDKDRKIWSLQVELDKINHELENVSHKLKNTFTGNIDANGKEKELENSLMQSLDLLKCSTCRKEFRNTIITKCMHTFCKSCVDARISHRQRKCPYCSLQFAQSDVQALFFQ